VLIKTVLAEKEKELQGRDLFRIRTGTVYIYIASRSDLAGAESRPAPLSNSSLQRNKVGGWIHRCGGKRKQR
jgi:hypothetical protein